MSGANDSFDSDDDLFGFIDEFIEDEVDTSSQYCNDFFADVNNCFELSFDTLPRAGSHFVNRCDLITSN
ncbi:hypothetical protein L9W76_17535, partial [Vibrio aestuarianus]|uniref:hypothetical protein n=1 Tax=Vibrio aestuarianus TaxID=28171 RepID=UPI00237C66D5